MYKRELPPFIGSSVDATKLSLTIKSVLYGIIPVVVLVAKLKGWDIGETQITNLIDVIVQAVAGIITGITSVTFLFGLARKGYYLMSDYVNGRK